MSPQQLQIQQQQEINYFDSRQQLITTQDQEKIFSSIENKQQTTMSIRFNDKYNLCLSILTIVIIILVFFQLVLRAQLIAKTEEKYQKNVEIFKKYVFQTELEQYKIEKLVSLNNQILNQQKLEDNLKKIRARKYEVLSILKNAQFLKQQQQQQKNIESNQVRNALTLMQVNSPNITSPLIQIEYDYYQQKYHISQYAQLPICVVITSYNNAEDDRNINNINSILTQEYTNYHIIFIDDGSEDSTSDDVIRIMINQQKLNNSRYILIKNNERQLKLYNILMAANSYCQPDDIFMEIDGDDQLIGRQVFKIFNAAFQEQKAWFVYSNSISSSNDLGGSKKVPNGIIDGNIYRQYQFVTHNLRAFYTQLLRNIKEEDLRDSNGEYFEAANDIAISFPILEQVQNRIHFVPEVTYYQNTHAGLNIGDLRQKEYKRNEKQIRSKQGYKRLDKLIE